jgi:hypothetical protein
VAVVQLIQPTVITANPDGTISAAPLGQKETFVEVAPFLWRQFNGHDRIQASVVDGKVTRWSTDSAAPIFVFVRAGGLLGAGLTLPLAMIAMAFLALTAATWPGAAIARWRYRQAFALTGARAAVYRLIRLCAALSLVAVGLWVAVIQLVSETTGAAVSFWLHTAQAVSLLAFGGGAVLALVNLWLVFRARSGISARVFAVLLIPVSGYMLWLALQYHLIGLSGQY